MLIRWIISALGLLIVSYVVPGFHVSSFWTALITALVLGLINLTIRPLLLLLTLPVNILTLGLFTLVINALMIMLASTIVKGFSVDNFGSAFIGGILLMLIGMLETYIAGQGARAAR